MDSKTDLANNSVENFEDSFSNETPCNNNPGDTNDDDQYVDFDYANKEEQVELKTDTKKRKLDDDKSSNEKSKRNNHNRNQKTRNERQNNASRGDDQQEVHIKFLIPNSAAGGVIGRKGEKIGQIQKDAHVKIKMSKTNEHYPNTNDRVCLINGKIKGVVKAYELISARMDERSDKSSSHKSDDDRLKDIRLLIPSNTAGLLIGKGGSYIKIIKDNSGAFVKVSQKSNDLPERIVTIEGSDDKRFKALNLVVEKIAEDPQHDIISTLTYSNSTLFRENSNRSMDRECDNSLVGSSNFVSNLPSIQNNVNSIAGLNNLSMLIVNSGGSSQMTAESLMESLRLLGYMQHASKEIIESISVLMRYGLIIKDQSLGNSQINSNMNSSMNNSSSNSGYDRRNDDYRNTPQRNNNGMMNNNNYNNNNNKPNYDGNNMSNALQMLRNSLGNHNGY